MEQQTEQKTELKRTIGFFPALATVMGTVIGAGVYFKAYAVAGATGGVGLHLFAWFLGGVISICAGLTAAELAAAIPETGGMLRYIERSYGSMWSFLLGWAEVIIYFPANIAALSWIFGQQVANLLGITGNEAVLTISIIAAVSITLINFLGSKAGGLLQSVTLVLKLVPLALIVVFGLFNPHFTGFSLFPMQAAGASKSFFPALGAGLLATMFAYDGWIHAGNVAGEMKNPAKDLPKAISLGIAAIMVVYLLVNLTFLMSVPFKDISGAASATAVVQNVASVIFGGIGGKLVTIGILISVYGTINGYTMTGMRLPYVMGVERTLPFHKTWSKLSEKSAVPVNAGYLQIVISIILLFISYFSTDAFNMLTDLLVFVIWIFYTMVFVAVFILRKKEPDLERPYKVPLYPVIPILAIVGGVFILAMTLFGTEWYLALIGIVVTALGIPVYYYMKNKYNN